jgi:uncharacterized protein YxeA
VKTLLIVIAIILIVVFTVAYFIMKGRQLSRDKSLMPKPGMYDAERDRQFRQYDEDNER